MADQEAFLVPTDFWANEDSSEEALRCYVAPPLNQAMIAAVERTLGYVLPQAYLDLTRAQNGGLLKRRFLVLPKSDDELEQMLEQGHEPELKVITLTNIFGIGFSTPWSLGGKFGTTFMQQKWGYPKLGPAIAGCSDFGHSMVFLDYSAQGEGNHDGKRPNPAVVLVQKDADFKKTVLAQNFAEFIALLKNEAELQKAQLDFEQKCDELRFKLIAKRKEEEAKRQAEEEAKRAAEEAKRKEEEAKRQAEEEAKRVAEEAKRKEEEAKRQAEAESQRQAAAQAASERKEAEPKAAEASGRRHDSEQVSLEVVQRRLNTNGMVYGKHDFALRAHNFELYRKSVLERLGSQPYESLNPSEQAQFEAVAMVQGTGFKGSLIGALRASRYFIGAEGMLRLLVGELVQHHFAPNEHETATQRATYEHELRSDVMALLLWLELEQNGTAQNGTAQNGRYWLHFDDEAWSRILGYLPEVKVPTKQLTVANVSTSDVLSYSGKSEGFGLLEPITVNELVDFINGLSASHYHCAIIQHRSASDLPNFELGLPPALRNDVLTNLTNFVAANYPDNEVDLIAYLIDHKCYGSCLNNVLFGGMARYLPDSMLFDIAQGALMLDLNRYALSLVREQVDSQGLYLALYIMGMAYYGMCRTAMEQQRRILLFSKKQEQGLTSVFENMQLPRTELYKMSQQSNSDIKLFARKALEALGTYQQLQADSSQERMTLARQAQSYLQRLL